MTFQKALLATLIAGSLTACGGDSSSSGNTTADPSPSVGETLNGKAADGYLQDALVCLDLDQNKSCDDGEPSAITDQNGGFSLVATQEQIDASPLLVEVIAGKTTDSDEPGVAIVKSYKLTAPAASEFVSPITTLIQNEIEKGGTPEEAVTTIQGLLGTDLDITQDYIAGQADDTKKDELKKLHRVAQVTARVIATKLDELKDEAANNGVSDADLINVINEEVSKVVSDIVADVENTPDGDFNADDAATSAKDKVDVSAGNIKDKVDSNKADRNKVESSIKRLIEEEGLLWLGGAYPQDNAPALEYGVVSVDGQGDVVEDEYVSNADLSAFTQKADEPTTLLMLASNGWILADDKIVDVTTSDTGIDTLVMQSATLSQDVKAKKVDVSGLRIKEVLAKTADEGVWSNVFSKETKFPEGTYAYELMVTPAASDYYTVYPGEWCGENTVGGMCNALSFENGIGPSTPLETLEQLVKQMPDGTAANTTLMGGLNIGQHGGGLVTELLADGTVNYYTWDYAEEFSGVIGSGTWRDMTVHGQVIREVTAPSEVINNQDLTWSNFDRVKGNAYMSVVDDYVRIAGHSSTQVEEEYVFGADTLQFIVDNISFTAPDPI